MFGDLFRMSRVLFAVLCIRRSSCAFALHDILIAPKEHFLFISYSLNILVLPSPPFSFPIACSTFRLHRDVRGRCRMPVETRLENKENEIKIFFCEIWCPRLLSKWFLIYTTSTIVFASRSFDFSESSITPQHKFDLRPSTGIDELQ